MRTNIVLRVFLLIFLITPLTACGVKGKLKTPEQIEKLEAKEAKKAQEEAAKNAESTEESVERK